MGSLNRSATPLVARPIVVFFFVFVAAAVGLPLPVSAAPLVIDEFKDENAGVWPVTLENDPAPFTTTNESGLNFTLGGGRLMVADAVLDVAADKVRLDVFIDASNDFFDYASSIGASGRVVFDYEMNSVDFTGQTHLRLTLLGFDLPSGQSMLVKSDVTTNGLVTFLPDVSATTPGPQDIDIPLSGVPANRLADIDDIIITLELPRGADLRLDRISAVPEPAAAAALLVLPALFTIRRRPG